MKLNWNFLGDGWCETEKTISGGGGGEYGYFLELQHCLEMLK